MPDAHYAGVYTLKNRYRLPNALVLGHVSLHYMLSESSHVCQGRDEGQQLAPAQDAGTGLRDSAHVDDRPRTVNSEHESFSWFVYSSLVSSQPPFARFIFRSGIGCDTGHSWVHARSWDKDVEQECPMCDVILHITTDF